VKPYLEAEGERTTPTVRLERAVGGRVGSGRQEKRVRYIVDDMESVWIQENKGFDSAVKEASNRLRAGEEGKRFKPWSLSSVVRPVVASQSVVVVGVHVGPGEVSRVPEQNADEREVPATEERSGSGCPGTRKAEDVVPLAACAQRRGRLRMRF
jgi:hypothetical protein